MKVIIPCAGKSSRFPNMRPKWMLTHPDGDLMVKKAFQGIKGVSSKDLIITILKEHEEKYDIIKGLKENIGKDITIVVLDEPTRSQPETIYKTLVKVKLREPFLIKDSDNYFEVDADSKLNYVCYSNLDDYDEINAKNKSYIVMNEKEIVMDVVEKKIVSKYFNVGGYFFKNPKDYVLSYRKLSKICSSELYTSHIIEDLIMNSGEIFVGKKVQEYCDWGTLNDWQRYRTKFKTYFFDIDGIFIKNSSQYFKPRWDNAPFIENNIKFLKKISKDPFSQIFFVTARPENYRKKIEKLFLGLKIKYSGILMGCLHAQRIIVNDFSDTSPYPTCEAINIPRDSEELEKYLR